MLALSPCNASQVDLKTKITNHQGRPRMPLAMKVFAELEDGILTATVANYSGAVEVFIYNKDGIVVEHAISTVMSNGTVVTDVVGLPEGVYTIEIGLGDTVYEGEFNI